jgi:hypothetical protein
MPSLAPLQPPSRAQPGSSRQLRCRTMPSTRPYRTLPRKAGCTVRVSVHTSYVARTRARRDLPPAPPSRPFARALDAHVTRPSPPTSFSEPPRRHICAGGPARWALQFWNPVRVWQAEEAVANLPLRLAVRGHCQRASAQPDGVHARGTQAGLKCGYSTVLTGYPSGYTTTGVHTRASTKREM